MEVEVLSRTFSHSPKFKNTVFKVLSLGMSLHNYQCKKHVMVLFILTLTGAHILPPCHCDSYLA